jgi:outer membrane immunogenic protein
VGAILARRYIFAALLLVSSVATASAAPPAPLWSWSGFYIGGNVGYSFGSSKDTLSLSDATTGALLDSASAKSPLDGFVGGGQIGYNWQRDSWVFGLEADYDLSGQKGSTALLCPGATDLPPFPAGFAGVCSAGQPGETIPALPVTDQLNQRLDWFGTVRARVGTTTLAPNFLPYLTGGLAYGEVHTTDLIAGTNFNIMGTPSAVSATINSDTTRLGWTIGGGVDHALSEHWIARVEYLYLDLGSVSGSTVTPIVTASGHFLAASFTSHVTDNIVRVGLSYKFN